MQKELEEEAECKKQFKASPIPPSTFQSRLKHIEEKQVSLLGSFLLIYRILQMIKMK